MKIICDACHTGYDSFGDDLTTASCPCCEHVNRPHGQVETGESVDTLPLSPEDTADRGEEPMKTMVLPADGTLLGTGATDVRALRAKGRPSLAEGVTWKLVAIENGKGGRAHPIRKSHVTIGRGRCDIRLRDPEVSREHCVIEVYGGTALIKDLQSANGTLLNGQLIREHVVKDGDQIRIGSMVFQLRATTARKAA